MDETDPAGADVSLDPTSLNPASGQDPSRLVKLVPTAATAIYPNVISPMESPLTTSTRYSNVPTPQALQGVPLINSPVNLQPPSAVANLQALARQNPNLRMSADDGTTMPVKAGASPPISPTPAPPQQMAQNAPQPYDYANRPKPPGYGQGMFGTNRPNMPQYDPNADPQEVEKQILKSQADQQMDRASDPFRQLFYRHGAEQNAAEAAQKYNRIKQIEQEQQRQKDIQSAGQSFGYKADNNATQETLVQEAIKRYRAGGDDAMQARDFLLSIGHKDQVEAFEPDFIAAAEARKNFFKKDIQDKLDAAKTDDDYNRIRNQIIKSGGNKHDDSGTIADIPKTRAEWDAKKAQRQEAQDRMNIRVDQYKQERENVTNFIPPEDPKVAANAAGRATFYDNTPIANAQGRQRVGDLAMGGQLPDGSQDKRGYGRTWGNYTGANRTRNEAYIEKTLPKEERNKIEGLLRINEGAIHDDKGNLLPAGEINTNPVMLQGLAETLTAILRMGAGGANASMMALEFANRGWLGNKINDVAKFFGALKGVVKGDGSEGKFLSKMSQKEKRDVLDFIMKYTSKDVGDRMTGPAREAGMMGATPKELGLGELFKFPGVEEAYKYGRDKQILHHSQQYEIPTDNGTIVLGDSPAFKNIKGAKRNPIPESQLEGLHPELFTPPPPPTSKDKRSELTPEQQKLASLSPTLRMEADTGSPLPANAQTIIQQTPETPRVVPGTTYAPQVRTAQATPPTASVPNRSGGTFYQNAPTGGFPASINNNPAARGVYGTTGQAAYNILKESDPNNAPTMANNAAIVGASSAQSESSFDPELSHDGGRGYGLFGHNGDRLAAMHRFAGTKPGQSIPPNVQSSFYGWEITKAAQTDPFIAQTLRNPNASAEDLTRVQIRMEQPKGYKGPGTEEQANNWVGRLAHTRALMGATAVGQPAAPAATAIQAAQPPAAPMAQPQAGRLNPANVRQALAGQTEAAQPIFNETLPNAAPAIGGTVGGLMAGPPGALAGGVIGGMVRHGIQAPQEERTLPGYSYAGAKGGIEAIPAMIPGAGGYSMAARVAAGAATQGGLKWWEGGDADQITAASLEGAGGAAFGEAVGQALGMVGHQLWGTYSKEAQAKLLGFARTLATEQPKVKDAMGKLVDNPNYIKAQEGAKAMGQEEKNLAYAWNQAVGNKAKGQPTPTRNEAILQRPGGTEMLRQGEQLQNIENIVGQLPKPRGLANAPQFTHDPTAIVGKPMSTGGTPNTQFFRDTAATAKTQMMAPAKDWDGVWSNVTQARTDLLEKYRATSRMAEGPEKEEMQKGLLNMANHVRGQQEEIIRKLSPSKEHADAMIAHLETTSNAYRKAVIAGGDDIVATIARGGPKGKEAQEAFNELAAKDPQAKAMLHALTTLHGGTGLKVAGGSVGLAGILHTAGAASLPLVGPAIAPVLATVGAVKGFQLLKAWMVQRGGGNPVKFEDLVRRAGGEHMPARGGQIGSMIGSNMAAPSVNAVTDAIQGAL